MIGTPGSNLNPFLHLLSGNLRRRKEDLKKRADPRPSAVASVASWALWLHIHEEASFGYSNILPFLISAITVPELRSELFKDFESHYHIPCHSCMFCPSFCMFLSFTLWPFVPIMPSWELLFCVTDEAHISVPGHKLRGFICICSLFLPPPWNVPNIRQKH